MDITEEQWRAAARVVRRSIRTSMHCSIASRNPDGSPHVTPIGSVLLNGVGSAMYFDMFNRRLAANIDEDPRVTILAVDSSRGLWLKSLIKGEFVSPPGIRLVGTVGAPRNSTPAEVARFHRVIGPLLRTPGGKSLWATLPRVRDVEVQEIGALSIGSMTR
jgi:uncharacterized protein